MLERARARGAYDALVEADIVDHLQDTARGHDLVVAADVFIYVGALEAVFAGVASVLAAGGVFAFSVELAGEAHDYRLLPSSRYAHSRRYLRTLAAAHGLAVRQLAEHPLREDQRRPVPGLYAVLQKP
jgi:predicted TPR repeat methyltransferase